MTSIGRPEASKTRAANTIQYNTISDHKYNIENEVASHKIVTARLYQHRNSNVASHKVETATSQAIPISQ